MFHTRLHNVKISLRPLAYCILFASSLILNQARPSFCQDVRQEIDGRETRPLTDLQRHQNSPTVETLLAKLNSPDSHESQEAARYLYTLRNHYMDTALTSLSTHRLAQGETLSASLGVLNILRPSDLHVAGIVGNKLSFDASELSGPSISPQLPYHPAADVLERMSLPALPFLAHSIANSPAPREGNLSNAGNIYFFRSLAILGPALEDWLTENAKTTTSKIDQQKFKRIALFVLQRTTTDGTRSYGTIRSIEGSSSLEGGFDDGWFRSLSPQRVQLQWNLTDPLLNSASLAIKDNETHAANISQELNSTLGLTEYLLVRQLEGPSQPWLKSKVEPSYSNVAQTNAIRVLGALRCDYAPWVIWKHLQQRSSAVLIDKDDSEETKVCLKALCQIDIPAVKVLVKAIPTELGLEQRRAATYALSRILGRYTIPYLEREISICEDAGKSDQEMHSQYKQQAQWLKEMLELGKEKKWFEGDYYGAHDPYAYDLVFDTASASAKMSNP